MAGKKAVGNIFRKFANIRYVFGKNGFQIEDNYWSRKLNIVGKAQRPKKKRETRSWTINAVEQDS